ncbi:tetratricopeptide repeat protein [Myxococcota bacterium]|nr:tetratricopeptide repeat protein [Myxococcota bacterium]MBU1899780.1 tetratricopeptide repeat protein [Myxococcota bacterium]
MSVLLLCSGLILAGVNAQEAFWKGDYAAAVEGYQQIVAAHPKSADAWYNLGTAALEAGRVGVAIHALEQALLLRPGDEDAEANLEAARARAIAEALDAQGGRVIIPGDDDLGTGVLTAVQITSVAWLTALGALLTFGLLALWWSREGPRVLLSAALVMIGLVTLGCGGFWLSHAYLRAKVQQAVVIESGALRAGPGPQYQTTSRLVGGVKVRARGAPHEGWRKVILPAGGEGWLPDKAVRLLEMP